MKLEASALVSRRDLSCRRNVQNVLHHTDLSSTRLSTFAHVIILCRVLWHQVDPSGKRTIGVLTKPDLINPGGEAEVLEVLSNNRKPLKLGYVMVKVRHRLCDRQNVSSV